MSLDFDWKHTKLIPRQLINVRCIPCVRRATTQQGATGITAAQLGKSAAGLAKPSPIKIVEEGIPKAVALAQLEQARQACTILAIVAVLSLPCTIEGCRAKREGVGTGVGNPCVRTHFHILVYRVPSNDGGCDRTKDCTIVSQSCYCCCIRLLLWDCGVV